MPFRTFTQEEKVILSTHENVAPYFKDNCIPIIRQILEESEYMIDSSRVSFDSICGVQSSDGMVFFGQCDGKKAVFKKYMSYMESVVVVEVFCGVLVDQLQLKNVMKTVGLAIINKCPYAVFELIEGKMLSEVFKPMTREELTVISEKMIDTLCELEKIGFSHNGIHSNNVMIDKEGSPILIDYSKASIVHDGFIICCERDMKEFVSEDRFEQDRLYFEMSIYDKRY